MEFSRVLLTGTHDEALKALDDIEQAVGFSLWGIENRFAVLQQAKGLEAQKAYLASIRGELRSLTAEFLAYFLSERNEETTNPENFRRTFIEGVPQATTNPEFASYTLYRLADYWSNTPRAIAAILRWEYISSLVDYYETFVRLATRAVCESPGVASPIATAAETVNDFLDDERLKKLAFVATGETKWLVGLPVAHTNAADAYYRGEHSDAIAIATNGGERAYTESLIVASTAAADQESSDLPETSSPLWDRIADLLLRVTVKNKNYEESYLHLLRIATNFQNFHFGAAVAYATKIVMSPDVRPDNPLAIKAAVLSWGIPSWLLQFVPIASRDKLATLLNERGVRGESLEAEKCRANISSETNPLSALSPTSSLEVRLDAAWARQDWSAVITLANDADPNAGPRHRRYVWQIAANAMIEHGDIESAVEHIARKCLADRDCVRQMPIRRCVNALTEPLLQQIANRLSTPILLELYSRHVEDRPTELRYAHEDFLVAHGFNRPSEITPLLMTEDRAQIVYYLRHVCVPRVMQLSPVFENSRSVQTERVAVCNLLKDLDPAHQSLYDAEIREISRKLSISQGLRQVEQSKIWVDQEPLKRWAEKNLSESFVRYQALRLAGLGVDVKGASDSFKAVAETEPLKQSEVPELPADEAHELLTRMVSQFVSQCFLNRQHGLNSYLSLRIRHGVLSGQLRGPLETEKIITLQREAGSGDYAPNLYWIQKLATIDRELALSVDARLRDFSKAFDRLINAFTKERVQIRGDEHKEGLFVAGFVPAKVVFMSSDIHSDTTFDGFVELLLTVFWDSVDRSLLAIRDYIDNTLLPEVNSAFISLLRDIEKTTAGYHTPELDNAIRNAQTNVRHAVEQVKDWFSKPKSTAPTLMTFKGLVDVSLEAVRNMYREFEPNVTLDIADLPLFYQLQKFTDIFIIIFSNIWRHCGLRSPRVTVRAFSDEHFLHIQVTNDVADGVRNFETEARVEEISRKIAEGRYHPALSSEGGTGLMKIRNIVGADREAVPKIDFGFDGSHSFRIHLQLHSTIFQVDQPEETA